MSSMLQEEPDEEDYDFREENGEGSALRFCQLYNIDLASCQGGFSE